MTQIALIACASQKLSHRAKARDLYTSTLFRLNLREGLPIGKQRQFLKIQIAELCPP